MVTGSVAAMMYGVPRLTNDIDIVASLTDEQARSLHAMFPPDTYYVPPEEVLLVELRRTRRGHFNLLHMPTGLKADIYLEGTDALHQWGLQNIRFVAVEGVRVPLAPPEYVLVRKMEFYIDGRSEKHLKDIEGILLSSTTVDTACVTRWARERRLDDLWSRLIARHR